MAQQQAISQLGKQALPLAFKHTMLKETDNYRSRAVPGLTAVGEELRGLEQERVMAPYANLQRYSNIINPIASGFQHNKVLNNLNLILLVVLLVVH